MRLHCLLSCLLAGLLPAAAASAQEEPRWTLVSSNPVLNVYLDEHRRETHGPLTTVWVLFDDATPDDAARDPTEPRSTAARLELDCAAKTARLLAATPYGARMGRGQVKKIEPEPGLDAHRAVSPESHAARVMKVAC